MRKIREIVLSGKAYQGLRHHLSRGPTEQLAFALASPNQGNDRLQLVVHEVIPVPREGLKQQTATYLEAKDEYVRPILARCLHEGKSLMEIHSHPFVGSGVSFSGLDTESDLEKFLYIAEKIPSLNVYHATVVMGRESVAARMWSREVEAVVPIHCLRIVEVPLKLIPTTTARPLEEAYRSLVRQGCLPERATAWNWQAYSRQILAFGREGQERLRQSYVGIVGLGGIGSVVGVTLGHLGVGRLLLVDPEELEETNLNRWLGGSVADARSGVPKVAAARAYIERVNPNAEVKTLQSLVFAPDALKALKEVDAVFGCTDNEASRLLLNRLASQYCLPYIDCGSGLFVEGGAIEAAGGQVRVILPDGPCLECMGGIDRQRAALELMPQADRERQIEQGYVAGIDIAAPSVMPLNETVASLATMEFMNLLLGFKAPHPYIFYDTLRSTVQPIGAEKNPSCLCCGPGSSAGMGDLEPLPSELPSSGAPVPPQLDNL